MAKRGPDIGDTPQERKLFRRKTHLLAIAIDDYKHCPRLYNCRRDAKRFIRILTEKYQFSIENVTTLYDEEATEDNILDAFKALIPRVGPEDSLAIIYSGHGEYEKDIDEGYWIPVEARPGEPSGFISNSRIIKYLKAIEAHHILLIVDSCFSGSLFTTRRLEGSQSVQRLDSIASRWLLTAGRNEVVSDGKPGDNSPFADNILYFLERNEQSSLSISELAQHVIQGVAYNSRQTPRGEPLQDVGHRGGQFHFHQKGVAQAVPEAEQVARPIHTPAPAPERNKRKYTTAAIILFVIIGVSGFFLLYQYQNGDSAALKAPSQPIMRYDSLMQRGQLLLKERNDSVSLLRAAFIFEEALDIAEAHTGIQPERAKSARYQCQLKLQELGKQTQEPPSAPSDPQPQTSPDQRAWQQAKQKDKEAAYRRYLSEFPKGKYVQAARDKIASAYRYQLDFGTSVSNNTLTVRINRGQAPYRIEVSYNGQQLRRSSEESVVKIKLDELHISEGNKVISVIVRDNNFKAKGAKTLVY